MESKDSPTKEKEKEHSKLINSDNMLKNLKSDYFIQKFFDYIQKRRTLKTIRYNKIIQKRIYKILFITKNIQKNIHQ